MVGGVGKRAILTWAWQIDGTGSGAFGLSRSTRPDDSLPLEGPRRIKPVRNASGGDFVFLRDIGW